ncbi:hypothetical protein [Nocardia asiatica]
MTLDRTGEPRSDGCPYRCRPGGWLTPEAADVQRPCPLHRPRRAPTETNDYDPSRLSERARAAIDKADREDRRA